MVVANAPNPTLLGAPHQILVCAFHLVVTLMTDAEIACHYYPATPGALQHKLVLRFPLHAPMIMMTAVTAFVLLPTTAGALLKALVLPYLYVATPMMDAETV